MKLIVGLGNPGTEYKNTRHNIGFMVIDHFAKQEKIIFHKKFNGMYAKIYKDGEFFLLLKPLSYMNLSGTIVKKYVDYFKIDPSNILVIHDDMDLPCGKIKIKCGGSSGGHNGVQNIIDEINSKNFSRFKIGIDKNKDIDVVNYVLGQFTDSEFELINKAISISSKVIDDFLNIDIDRIMNKYNGENNEFK